MTKQETQIMKGVAILMMLILHLFGKTTDGYASLLYLGGEPIEYILRAAVNPVAFFLVLSGYGMHYVCSKGKDTNKWNRVWKIYLHWWVSLGLFSLIGCLLQDRSYYSDVYSIVANYTGYECTWNYEGWFMFPYILLMLSAPWIFNYLDRFKSWLVATFFVFLGLCLGFVVSRYRDVLHLLVYNPIFTMMLISPSFVLGGILHKEQIIHKVKSRKYNSLVLNSMLILLIILVCFVQSAALNNAYAFLFTILFLVIQRWRYVDIVLAFLGKHSMNIWFTHTWFSNYLFHEEIYSLQYSILIFLTVLSLSVMSSFVLEYICSNVNRGVSRIRGLLPDSRNREGL